MKNYGDIKLQRPSVRVARSMGRISRDKWLSGDDVWLIGYKLARCASPARPHHVVNASFPLACFHVGMINGVPPFHLFEREKYLDMLSVAKKYGTGKFGARVELEILKIINKHRS